MGLNNTEAIYERLFPLCHRRCGTDSGFIPPVVFEGIISPAWKRPLSSCQAHCSRCALGFRRARADTFINMTPCFVLLASFWLAMAFELETGKLIGLRLMHGNRGLWEKAGWPRATHDRQIMTVELSSQGYLSAGKYRFAFLTSFFHLLEDQLNAAFRLFQTSYQTHSHTLGGTCMFLHLHPSTHLYMLTNTHTQASRNKGTLNVCAYNCDFLHRPTFPRNAACLGMHGAS